MGRSVARGRVACGCLPERSPSSSRLLRANQRGEPIVARDAKSSPKRGNRRFNRNFTADCHLQARAFWCPRPRAYARFRRRDRSPAPTASITPWGPLDARRARATHCHAVSGRQGTDMSASDESNTQQESARSRRGDRRRAGAARPGRPAGRPGPRRVARAARAGAGPHRGGDREPDRAHRRFRAGRGTPDATGASSRRHGPAERGRSVGSAVGGSADARLRDGGDRVHRRRTAGRHAPIPALAAGHRRCKRQHAAYRRTMRPGSRRALPTSPRCCSASLADNDPARSLAAWTGASTSSSGVSTARCQRHGALLRPRQAKLIDAHVGSLPDTSRRCASSSPPRRHGRISCASCRAALEEPPGREQASLPLQRRRHRGADRQRRRARRKPSGAHPCAAEVEAARGASTRSRGCCRTTSPSGAAARRSPPASSTPSRTRSAHRRPRRGDGGRQVATPRRRRDAAGPRRHGPRERSPGRGLCGGRTRARAAGLRAEPARGRLPCRRPHEPRATQPSPRASPHRRAGCRRSAQTRQELRASAMRAKLKAPGAPQQAATQDPVAEAEARRGQGRHARAWTRQDVDVGENRQPPVQPAAGRRHGPAVRHRLHGRRSLPCEAPPPGGAQQSSRRAGIGRRTGEPTTGAGERPRQRAGDGSALPPPMPQPAPRRPAPEAATDDPSQSQPAPTRRLNRLQCRDGVARPPAGVTPVMLAPQDRPDASAPAADGATDELPASIGTPKLRQAAAAGDAFAQFEIATRFAEGKGVAQDHTQAFAWYERAATRGLASAQFRLAAYFERGVGVAADKERARVWYSPRRRAGLCPGHAQPGRPDRRQRRGARPTTPPPRTGSGKPPSVGSPTANSIWPSCMRTAAACRRTCRKPTSGSRWRPAAAIPERRAGWSR